MGIDGQEADGTNRSFTWRRFQLLMQKSSTATNDDTADTVFLPDLCGVTALFVVVVVGELVALVIVITGTGFSRAFFNELALVSFYTQWLGLSSAAVLCAARKPLNGFDERSISVICYLLILIVAYTVAELAWWVVNPVDDAGALIELSRGELILRTLSVSAIVGALVLRYFYVQFHWKQRIASEASARLEALQARIRPHFFFNCMNTIASLTRSDPQLAERAVEDLADLFRANLADARAPVPIDEEIAFVERYLNIERLRLGDRLAVDWQIDEMPDGARLPLLSLQPIVENAIYHGIEPLSAGGTVEISARVVGGQLEVTVANPFNEKADSGRRGNRIALDNVKQRLRAHFGEAADIRTKTEDARYEVRLVVPLTGGGA
ncbi:MAG: sensor histidine kinase [Proteobacteria bacterium]|nr:sensor histidine kinase [Pseudomonadota bacterium]